MVIESGSSLRTLGLKIPWGPTSGIRLPSSTKPRSSRVLRSYHRGKPLWPWGLRLMPVLQVDQAEEGIHGDGGPSAAIAKTLNEGLHEAGIVEEFVDSLQLGAQPAELLGQDAVAKRELGLTQPQHDYPAVEEFPFSWRNTVTKESLPWLCVFDSRESFVTGLWIPGSLGT